MKKFEEYNIKYAHLARTDSQEEPHIQDLARDMTSWPNVVKGWAQHRVQDAVYNVPDHEEWQKFRCSLKGQSTQMKLARLHLYLQNEIARANSVRGQELAQIRVDNYLGALVRGGQLSMDLKVKS